MKRTPEKAAEREGGPIRPSARSVKISCTGMGLALAVCLALMAGCVTSNTVVNRVWRDKARTDGGPGRTLVVAVFPNPEVAVPIEDELTRQLRERGIEAVATNDVLPGERSVNRQVLVNLVKAKGFSTVLLSRLVEVKKVEREYPVHQVAVVDTELYDARTEKPFWSARSDTFLGSPTADRVGEPRSELIREFVETIIQEMSKSKVL